MAHDPTLLVTPAVAVGLAVGLAFGLVPALAGRGLPYVVIEPDHRIVEALRRPGTHAIFGDASRPVILAHAHPERARLLVGRAVMGERALALGMADYALRAPGYDDVTDATFGSLRGQRVIA